MKKVTLILSFALVSSGLFAQKIEQGNVQINTGLRLLSSPSAAPLTNIDSRIYGDLEFNYFAQDRFAVGLGFDYNTALNRTSFSPGMRYYWVDPSFFRIKLDVPMDFSTFDVNMGIGYNYMISESFGLESNLDYYIRGGVAVYRMGFAIFL